MISDPVGAPSGPGADRPALLTHAEPAMGTVFSVVMVPGDLAGPDLRSALRAACATLHHANAVFSTWDRQSPVSRFRRGEADLGQLPGEVAEVVADCRSARQISGGWFDPWAMPGGFDPTGLVKGWAVDRALAILRESGMAGAMVNGGGDLAAFGFPAPGQRWRVGIRHPWCADALAGIIEVGAAVATSGSYERGAHLIDPATAQPAGRSASATVTGPSLAMADALATAVAVGGDEALAVVAGVGGYDAYLIRPDGTETQTGGIAFVS
ncbi:MAG TPA: FAD:protein FMN transferase [Streptosporangiaceae bacterium]|nr:FAD:protein FMN transferase [Streptosporangiaceae bacterium]